MYVCCICTPYTPLPFQDFILHHCVFTPYSHHHFITATIHHMVFPLVFVRLCIILLDLFGYIFPYLSISPFQFSLTLPFYFLRLQLVFSHPPITSFHLISAIFTKCFPFLTTIPDEGLSLKRRIIKFFSKELVKLLMQRVKIAHSFLQSVSNQFHVIILRLPT